MDFKNDWIDTNYFREMLNIVSESLISYDMFYHDIPQVERDIQRAANTTLAALFNASCTPKTIIVLHRVDHGRILNFKYGSSFSRCNVFIEFLKNKTKSYTYVNA